MSDFYEEDEPIEKIEAAFAAGEKGVTVKPDSIVAAGDPRGKPATWLLMPICSRSTTSTPSAPSTIGGRPGPTRWRTARPRLA